MNSSLTNRELRDSPRLIKEARLLLDQAAKKLNLSARGYIKTVKVAHTIADLNDSDKVTGAEITEALQYRKKPIEL